MLRKVEELPLALGNCLEAKARILIQRETGFDRRALCEVEGLLSEALTVFERFGSAEDANAARVSYLRARGYEKAGLRNEAVQSFERYLALTEFG